MDLTEERLDWGLSSSCRLFEEEESDLSKDGILKPSLSRWKDLVLGFGFLIGFELDAIFVGGAPDESD